MRRMDNFVAVGGRVFPQVEKGCNVPKRNSIAKKGYNERRTTN